MAISMMLGREKQSESFIYIVTYGMRPTRAKDMWQHDVVGTMLGSEQVALKIKPLFFFASSASEPLSGTGHCKTKEGKQETGFELHKMG